MKENDLTSSSRTASISGAYVAVADAIAKLTKQGKITEDPMRNSVAAISVGIKNNTPILDLCYAEDANADVDMNIVMTGSGKFIEVQGTAEGEPFEYDQMQQMIELARKGIAQITEHQQNVLAEPQE